MDILGMYFRIFEKDPGYFGKRIRIPSRLIAIDIIVFPLFTVGCVMNPELVLMQDGAPSSGV
jgi:hypothetical protein